MAHDMSEIVCTCLNLTVDDIHKAIKNGADSYEAVVEATGATTICGLCEDAVREIVDEFI